jgi:hypothetical protein
LLSLSESAAVFVWGAAGCDDAKVRQIDHASRHCARPSWCVIWYRVVVGCRQHWQDIVEGHVEPRGAWTSVFGESPSSVVQTSKNSLLRCNSCFCISVALVCVARDARRELSFAEYPWFLYISVMQLGVYPSGMGPVGVVVICVIPGSVAWARIGQVVGAGLGAFI